MYNNGSLGGGALAATGLAFDALWLFLAGFALVAAAMAVARMLPKRGL